MVNEVPDKEVEEEEVEDSATPVDDGFVDDTPVDDGFVDDPAYAPLYDDPAYEDEFGPKEKKPRKFSEGGRHTVSSYSGGWWYDDYRFDAKAGSRAMRRRGITSLTGMGRELMGSYACTYDDTQERLRDSLLQLSRSANLLVNSVGDEKYLVVKYSDGEKKNEPGANLIYVSPDTIHRVKGKKYDIAMDALTGKVLLGSQLRKTMDKKVFKAVNEIDRPNTDQPTGAAYHLWKALEGSIARNEVVQDWVGLSPYFIRMSESSSDTKKQIEGLLAKEDVAAEPIIAGLAWNLFHDGNPVQIPEKYRDGVHAFAERVKDPIPANERFDACVDIAKAIYKLYPSMNPPSGGGKGEGKSGNGTDKIPSPLDDDLFGGKVKNEKSKKAANMEIREEEYGGTPNPNFERPDYSEMGTFVPNYEIHKFKSSPSRMSEYISLTRELHKEIDMVRKSLSFRNTERAIFDHGMLSGDLDEGSLYKIACDDPRLWERKEVVGEADVSIMILIDQSGSMSGSDDAGKKMKTDLAREVATAIYEGARGIRGVHICVLGYDSQKHGHDNVNIYEYFTPDVPRVDRIMHMKPGSNNLDGYAISYAAMRLYNLFPTVRSKYLFIISDGSPAGYGYNGDEAYNHVHNSAEKARTSYGCKVYGIGVANAYNTTLGDKMYGRDNYVVLNDVKSSLMILARFIRQISLRA